MKTITPDMKLDKQVQKGIAAVNHALDDGNLRKACYTIGVIKLMVDMFQDNQPTPWSQLSPMIDEEFNE
jgi:hypothetical protein